MATGVQYKVKGTGRVRGPNLSDPQLKRIGTLMVAEQKQRWANGVNADGQAAKKLSVMYAIQKQQYLHRRPFRDMSLTGRTVLNFQLRKAADGIIRAENTRVYERQKARSCQGYDQMIGFAVTDSRAVLDEAKREYGNYVKTAWIPLGGRERRPPQMRGTP